MCRRQNQTLAAVSLSNAVVADPTCTCEHKHCKARFNMQDNKNSKVAGSAKLPPYITNSARGPACSIFADPTDQVPARLHSIGALIIRIELGGYIML